MTDSILIDDPLWNLCLIPAVYQITMANTKQMYPQEVEGQLIENKSYAKWCEVI